VKSLNQKINIADWKSKYDAIKLASLKAKASINPPPFDDTNIDFLLKSAKEKRLIIKAYEVESKKKLLKALEQYPNNPHFLSPKEDLREVTATVAELITLAKKKAVGYVFIWDVKKAINLETIKSREREKANKCLKHLTRKESTTDNIGFMK